MNNYWLDKIAEEEKQISFNPRTGKWENPKDSWKKLDMKYKLDMEYKLDSHLITQVMKGREVTIRPNYVCHAIDIQIYDPKQNYNLQRAISYYYLQTHTDEKINYEIQSMGQEIDQMIESKSDYFALLLKQMTDEEDIS